MTSTQSAGRMNSAMSRNDEKSVQIQPRVAVGVALCLLQPAHRHRCRSRHNHRHSHPDSPRHHHLRAPACRVCHHLHARHDIHSRDFPCHIHRHNHRRPPSPQHREQTNRPFRPGKNPRKTGSHPSHQGNPRPRRGAQCLELKKVDTMRDQSKRVNGRKKSKA